VIGDNFSIYHFIVAAKWIIALVVAFTAIPMLLLKRKPV
jgi:hypothetical protein